MSTETTWRTRASNASAANSAGRALISDQAVPVVAKTLLHASSGLQLAPMRSQTSVAGIARQGEGAAAKRHLICARPWRPSSSASAFVRPNSLRAGEPRPITRVRTRTFPNST